MSLCFVVEPVDANGTWGGRKRHGEKGTAGQSVRWRRSVRERERGQDQGSFSRLVVAGDSNENKSAVRRTGSCVRVKRSCGPVKQRQRVRGDIISEREWEGGEVLSRRETSLCVAFFGSWKKRPYRTTIGRYGRDTEVPRDVSDVPSAVSEWRRSVCLRELLSRAT